MISKDLCEALYALPGGVVTPRRQPIVKPLVVALLGVVLLTIDGLVVEDKSGALSMTLMVLGITMTMFGALTAIMRAFSDKRVPYHNTSGYMHYSERYYDRMYRAELLDAIASGNAAQINAIKTTNISAITLAEFRSKDGSVVAYAIYEYDNFILKLAVPVKVVCR